jgi:hypothetical protein
VSTRWGKVHSLGDIIRVKRGIDRDTKKARWYAGSVNQVTSSGLERLYKLMTGNCVGFISAFREDQTLDENIKLAKGMEDTIRAKYLGYLPLTGFLDGKQAVRVFAVACPGILRDTKGAVRVLIANLVEVEQSNPKYQQRGCLVVSRMVSYFVAGMEGKSPAGTVIGEAGRFRDYHLNGWVEQTDGSLAMSRAVIARGTGRKIFDWSCGEFVDYFSGLPVFCRTHYMEQIVKAEDRVFGIIGG